MEKMTPTSSDGHQPGDVRQWEYRLIGFSRGKIVSAGSQKLAIDDANAKTLPRRLPVVAEYLEQAGLEGWEAVGLSDHWILLKRPITD